MSKVFFFDQGFDRWVDLRSFEERSRRSHLHDMNPDAAQIRFAVLSWLKEHREILDALRALSFVP